MQDLLRHTAGLTYGILGNDPIQVQYAKARLGSREHTNAEFAQALAQIPYRFEPGTVWEYSRATDLLGALVERISGQTLGAFLQDNILGPLGLTGDLKIKNEAPSEMFVIVGEHVFPFLRTLGTTDANPDSTYAHHMKDARFTIPTPALLAKVVDLLDAATRWAKSTAAAAA